MAGVLDGDRVRVPDDAEGSRLHNKGRYGEPLSGGGLELDLVEAAFLVELGRLDVGSHDLDELIAAGTRRRDGFEVDYLVYRDLRDRGFVVTIHDDGFRIYPRGRTPSEAEVKARVVPASERTPFEPDRLLDDLEAADADLLYALVDEESDLTYYDVDVVDWDVDRSPDLGDVDGEAWLLEDRALVRDPKLSEHLRESAFIGRLVDDRLQVSLVETAFLHEQGLTVRDAGTGDVLDADGLRDRARRVQDDFDRRSRAYEELTDRGLWVKTGFKYGTHFRCYRTHPDDGHAELLVHALPEGFVGSWPEAAGRIRLAQGVRKTMVFLVPRGPDLTGLTLKRARP